MKSIVTSPAWALLALATASGFQTACGQDDVRSSNAGQGARAGSSGGTGSGGGAAIGTELRIDVGSDAPTFVELATAREVQVDGDPHESTAWDLAFQGWDVFTNGGVSGPGRGSAFGPLSFGVFLFGEEPDVPFLIDDRTAGAFEDWYRYDGGEHTLYSRFHTYGVMRAERLFKLQLLGYYGEVAGAPVTALYQLRYAEVTPDGEGSTIQVMNLDASSGGLSTDDAASACLSLQNNEQQLLNVEQALASSSWDLCFRREAISVNGELGGPGDVSAVDLDAAATADETLEEVKTRTAAGAAAAFQAVDYVALTSRAHEYRGDRVVSAFSDTWADQSAQPAPTPNEWGWLVVASDGQKRFLLEFTGLENASAKAAGAVTLRVLQVR